MHREKDVKNQDMQLHRNLYSPKRKGVLRRTRKYLSGYFKTILFFFSQFLWRLFHAKLLQGSYLGSGLIYTTVQRFEVGKNAFKRCLIVSLRMHLFDQNKVKKQ